MKTLLTNNLFDGKSFQRLKISDADLIETAKERFKSRKHPPDEDLALAHRKAKVQMYGARDALEDQRCDLALLRVALQEIGFQET